MQKLSIIIPAYNEGATIFHLLDKVKGVDFGERIRTEIIVVNDCSKDDTEEEVLKFQRQNPDQNMVYLAHPHNRGKGAAIRTAIAHLTGDITIIQDADMEYEPEDIKRMLDHYLQHDLKVLYGSRFLNKNNKRSYLSFYMGGRIVSWIANILFFQRLTDEPTCYKMVDTALLKSIPLKCTRFEFCPEITAKIARQGIKIKEIPIRYYPRSIEEGKKITWHDGLEAIWTLLKYRFVT